MSQIKKIAICLTQVPFIRGGAELCAESLRDELQNKGFEVDIITLPFSWQPKEQLIKDCLSWRMTDLQKTASLDPIDLVICLKFPAYGIKHPNKVIWLFHQQREVYELYNTEFGGFKPGDKDDTYREFIFKYDQTCFAEAKATYALSQRVAHRLKHFNDIDAKPLYAPPKNKERFHEGPYGDYIFGISRLEKNKRLDLLIEAFRYTQSQARCIIVGDGPQAGTLREYIENHNIAEKVKIIGFIEEADLFKFYSEAFAVYFAPVDEDLGFITQEAFLSRKPIVTADDAGAVLEFVEHGASGLISQPNPKEIAANIDQLFADKSRCQQMGRAGYEKVANIGWDKVIKTLVANNYSDE